MKVREQLVLQAILIIFYTVGLCGVLIAEQPTDFLALTPLNLLLSFGVLLYANRSNFKKLVALFLLIPIGYGIELIGVQTGLLFGNYAYGANLGPTIAGVPPIIGLNWSMLIAACFAFTSSWFTNNYFWQALIVASLMTLLDVFIEPVAIKSNFWSWQNGIIPFYNFVCWFILSFVIALVYGRKIKDHANKIDLTLFFCLTFFFLTLSFF